MLLPLRLNLERRRKGGGAGYKMPAYRNEGTDRRKIRKEIELQDDLFLMEFLKTATYIINNQ